VCGPVGFGRFTIDAKVSLAGVTGPFKTNTFVYIYVGDFTFYGFLGDDPNYVVGKKRAAFVLSHVEAGRSKPMVDQQVGLTWNLKELRVHIVGNPSAYYPYSIFRDQIATAGIVNDLCEAGIIFGDAPIALFDMAVVGKSITTSNCVVNLFNVKIKGKDVDAGF